MWKLAAVALGGALGTALRYGVNIGMVRTLGPTFPWATLTVNVVGSLLLGVVMELSGTREVGGVSAKLVLGTGVLGGFTTYSSFNLETLRLFEQGAHTRALVYAVGTLALCLLAGLGGVVFARSLE